jgi:hypothetical protein
MPPRARVNEHNEALAHILVSLKRAKWPKTTVEKFTIDKITSRRRMSNGSWEYYVHWSTGEKTWEPHRTLSLDVNGLNNLRLRTYK